MEPPAEILDAIAADPKNDQAWHVLADWLLENGAPHAVLARYDLELDKGTRDPELIGDYAQARIERHRLPALMAITVEPIVWKCGYAVQATVRCYERPPGVRPEELAAELKKVFHEPALQAVNRLIIEGGPWTMPAWVAVPTVLAQVPRCVRRISVRMPRLDPAKDIAESLWAPRPPMANRIDLSLGMASVGDSLRQIHAAGWTTIDLQGTSVADDSLAAAVKDLTSCTLVLGGAGLVREVAAALDGDNVRWADPGVRCALLSDRGAIYPLDAGSSDRLTVGSLALVRDPFGWELVGPPRRRLTHGAHIEGHRTVEFIEVPDVHTWYREYLKG